MPMPDVRVREQTLARHRARALPFNGKQWQSIRKAVLDREPLCRDCDAIAIDVDHIDGDDSNNLFANLQPLCRSCHARKTWRERNEKSRGAESYDNEPPPFANAAAHRGNRP